MIIKTAWFNIDPLPPKEFERLCAAIVEDQFTEDTITGFIVDSARRSSIEARFIQKRILRETIVDPFGNESEIVHTSYIQTQFSLLRKSPNLVLINPPRAINPFLNRIGEYCQGKAAIYPPKDDTSALIDALIAKASSAKITGALISDIQIKGPAVAKILVRGTGDIMDGIQEIIGNRKHTIKEAQLEVSTTLGMTMKVTVKEGSRFSIHTEDEEAAMEYIREVLRNSDAR